MRQRADEALRAKEEVGRQTARGTRAGSAVPVPLMGRPASLPVSGAQGEKPNVAMEGQKGCGWSSRGGLLAGAVSCGEREPWAAAACGDGSRELPLCDAMPGAASSPRQGDRFLEVFRAHASAQISARDQSLASQRELGKLLADAIDQQVPSRWGHLWLPPAWVPGGLDGHPSVLSLGDALSNGLRWAWVRHRFLGAAAGKLPQIRPWDWRLPASVAVECGSFTVAVLTHLSCPTGVPGCRGSAFPGIHRCHLRKSGGGEESPGRGGEGCPSGGWQQAQSLASPPVPLCSPSERFVPWVWPAAWLPHPAPVTQPGRATSRRGRAVLSSARCRLPLQREQTRALVSRCRAVLESVPGKLRSCLEERDTMRQQADEALQAKEEVGVCLLPRGAWGCLGCSPAARVTWGTPWCGSTPWGRAAQSKPGGHGGSAGVRPAGGDLGGPAGHGGSAGAADGDQLLPQYR